MYDVTESTARNLNGAINYLLMRLQYDTRLEPLLGKVNALFDANSLQIQITRAGQPRIETEVYCHDWWLGSGNGPTENLVKQVVDGLLGSARKAVPDRLERRLRPLQPRTSRNAGDLPECPSCGAPIQKVPKRSAHCRGCDRPILVRSGQQIFPSTFLTEIQAFVVDWVKRMNGYGVSAYVYRSTEQDLRDAWGGPPHPYGVLRKILDDLLAEPDSPVELQRHLAELQHRMGEDPNPALQEYHRSRLALLERDDLVEIRSRWGACPQCRSQRERVYTVAQARRAMPIPCRDCQHQMGRNAAMCRCEWEVSFADQPTVLPLNVESGGHERGRLMESLHLRHSPSLAPAPAAPGDPPTEADGIQKPTFPAPACSGTTQIPSPVAPGVNVGYGCPTSVG